MNWKRCGRDSRKTSVKVVCVSAGQDGTWHLRNTSQKHYNGSHLPVSLNSTFIAEKVLLFATPRVLVGVCCGFGGTCDSMHAQSWDVNGLYRI
jgi:hypothetical protein